MFNPLGIFEILLLRFSHLHRKDTYIKKHSDCNASPSFLAAIQCDFDKLIYFIEQIKQLEEQVEDEYSEKTSAVKVSLTNSN